MSQKSIDSRLNNLYKEKSVIVRDAQQFGEMLGGKYISQLRPRCILNIQEEISYLTGVGPSLLKMIVGFASKQRSMSCPRLRW